MFFVIKELPKISSFFHLNSLSLPLANTRVTMRWIQFLCFLFIIFSLSQSVAQQILPLSDSVQVFDNHQLIIDQKTYRISKKHFIKKNFTQTLTKVKVVDSSAIRWGFVNREGIFTIPPVYDSVISTFENGRVILGRYFPEIEKNILFLGIVNQRHEPIVPVSFIEI